MPSYAYQDIVNAVWGATLLGSGGGGDIDIAMAIVQQLPRNASILVLDQGDADRIVTGTTVGVIGTPKLSPDPVAAARDIGIAAGTAFMTMLGHASSQGRRTNTLAPLSLNPLNVAVALFTAWQVNTEVYVCNCDGAGRSTSSLSTLSYSDGLPISPVFLCSVTNDDSRTVALEVPNPPAADSIMRSIIASPPFSGYGAASAWLMNSSQFAQQGIWGTLESARQAGVQITTNYCTADQIVSFLVNQLGLTAAKLVSGTLSVEREFEVTGLTRRRLRITAADGGYVRVYTEKESMTYWDSYLTSGNAHSALGPYLEAPTSICLFSNDTRKPLTDFNIPDFVGQSVSVIGIGPLAALTGRPSCMEAFARSLRALNYAGTLSYPQSPPSRSISREPS